MDTPQQDNTEPNIEHKPSKSAHPLTAKKYFAASF